MEAGETLKTHRLAATWEHRQYDIQRVARAHLQARVHELNEEDRALLVNHAITRLPANSRQHSDDKIAAVILLGVLAFVHKKALDKENVRVAFWVDFRHFCTCSSYYE